MLKSAFSAQCLRVIIVMNDETLPNFLKRKHPSKEEKKKQSAKCKDRAKEPQRVSPAEEKEPLSTETSTCGMKHIN